jgi:L-amino acid N-acyltransferase YncA
MIEIVDAQRTDAEAIASLHADSWRATYRGILPDEYLSREVDEDRLTYWRAALANGSYAIVRLLRDGEVPAGFTGLRKGRDDGYDFTLEHIHVAAACNGTGLGRLLMADAARQVQAAGGARLCLWVFDANAVAIRFYAALGGVADGQGIDTFAGGRAPDTRFGWHDLGQLIAACERRK